MYLMKRNYLIMAMLLPLLFAGCGTREEKQPVSSLPIKVKIQKVIPVAPEHTDGYSGTVEEDNTTSLSFAVAGTVKTMNVSLGQHVAAGQLIATLDRTSMQSAYDAAQASFKQAEDAYRRMQELHAKGSLPEIKWVEVQSKLQQARSVAEMAEKNLDDCSLYAPYGGVISRKDVEVGQNVLPGVSVVGLVSVKQLKVKISVPETEIADIALNREAVITVPALNNSRFIGKVVEKGIVANPLSRSYDVKIRVTDTDGRLLPGMVTRVALSSSNNRAIIVIPAHIVQLDEQNRSFVWMNQDGIARKRVVSIGGYTSAGIWISSGLKEGEEIITEGRQKVCEGTQVVRI